MSDEAEPTGEASAKKRLTPKQYADHLGVTRQSVQYAIAHGRLTPASAHYDVARKRWLIDPVLADAEWERNTRQRRGIREEVNGAASVAAHDFVLPDGAVGMQLGEHDLPIGRDGKPLPPMVVASIKTAVEARLKQLELEERRKNLVPADASEKILEHVSRQVRDAILSVPARMAHQSAAETDPAKTEIMWERALTDALVALVARQGKAA